MSGPTQEKADQLGLPERWKFCPKTGQVVEDLFFPFKTPLCGLYDRQLEPRLRFHPEDVFKSPLLKGKKIGLWIDLTKTDRFYYVNEVERHGCEYRKMKMEGHGSSPSEEQTNLFINVVKKFVEEHPGQLIGVHCTHGFNRTGFAIAAYMYNVMDFGIDYAVQQFAAKRPCGIYKQEYINDLFTRYGDDPEDVIEAPDKPSWEYGEDCGLDESVPAASTSNGYGGARNGNGVDNAGSSNGHASSGGGEKLFMDGLVKCATLVTDKSKKMMLQGKIKELCGARRDGFPGLQPVSLERSPARNNLALLAQRPYMVSWKADGMRYMVYICDEEEVYAFDRDNEVFLIEGLAFPHRKERRHVRNTLVDTEMIIDKVMENGVERAIPRLLIYDIIHFENIHVGKDNFDIRRACMTRELIYPRNEAMKNGTLNRNTQPMSVRMKEFWELESVPKLFEPKFTQQVGHEIDGLIFQPVDAPYTAGRCDIVLKWKPPSHNSIDFKLQIKRVHREGELPEYVGYLFVQHRSDPLDSMKATRTLQQYDNKIIECSYDVATRKWIFMRERTDKSLPNSVKTAEAVFNSMIHPINKEDLCSFIRKHGLKRKIPPQPQVQVRGPPPAKMQRQ